VMAAAATALAAADGRRAIAGSVLLLTGATLIHWNFVVVFGGILLVLALVLVKESLADRRAGATVLRTPSGRLGAILVGSAALGVGAILLAPGGPQSPPPSRGLFLKRLHAILPAYELPIAAPVAAAGATALWRPEQDAARSAHRARRRGLWFALAWLGSAGAAAVLLYAGQAVAAHRIIGFAFALPLLMAAAIVWVSRAAWRSRRTLIRAGGVMVLVAALAAGAFATQRLWFRTHASMPARAFGQASTAGVYLERYASGRQTVVVLDGSPSFVPLAVRVFRASITPDHISTLLPYLGDPDRLLAGQPTIRTDDRFNKASQVNWAKLEPLLGTDPVILMVQAFDRNFAQLTTVHPEWVVAPGVAVVRGPRPSAPLPPADAPRPTPGRTLILRAGAVLLILFVVGLGWSAGLIPSGWFERLALAPAFGIATLSLAGVVADRVGVLASGPPGVAIAALTAAAGWSILASRRVRASRSGRRRG
jgi:hypothetical protein